MQKYGWTGLSLSIQMTGLSLSVLSRALLAFPFSLPLSFTPSVRLLPRALLDISASDYTQAVPKGEGGACRYIYIYIHTKQWICILPDRGYLACKRSGKLLVQYRTIFSRFYTEHAIKTHSNVFYIAPKKGFHYGCNSFWGLYSSLYYGSLFNFVENGSIKNLSQSNI